MHIQSITNTTNIADNLFIFCVLLSGILSFSFAMRVKAFMIMAIIPCTGLFAIEIRPFYSSRSLCLCVILLFEDNERPMRSKTWFCDKRIKQMRIKIFVALVLAVLFGAGNAFSQEFLGYRDSFNLTNWKFYKGDIHSAESGDKISEQGWENVTVPHTWNAKDVLTAGDHCYQGVGWYRGSFDLPNGQKGKRYFIRFEGVCLVSDVYVNGVYIGRHKGGFSAFCYEITK